MREDLMWMPIDAVKPWDRNPRHNDKAAKKLVALLRAMAPDGDFRRVWTSPISVQAGTMRIIGGHTRWKAARTLGMDSVPVKVLEVDDGEATRLALADNRVGEEADWDDEQLAALLKEDANPIDLGFDDVEIKRLLAAIDPKKDDDVIPEPPKGPADSVVGAVYELGPHRLWCGDNTDPGIRAAAVVGVQAVVTDPPYGIDASAMTMGSGETKKPRAARLSAVKVWDGEAPPVAWLLDVAPHVVVWGGNYFADLPPSADWLVWDKKTRNLSFSEAELAWSNTGQRVRIIECMFSGGVTHKEPKEHITQKPVAVMVWSVEFVPQGAVVLDPFGGSGTTLIACAMTNRTARLIELDPAYCDVIRRRWTRYAKGAGIDPGPGALD